NLANVTCDSSYKKLKQATVGPSAVRGNANGVMGVSAHLHSGRGGEKPQGGVYRGDYEEWNHLIADWLGGPTPTDNVVAASAACNSCMLNIEACLRGKSNFRLKVKAYCSAEHVAEWIVYTIIANGNTFRKEIDATNKYFTREDGKELRKAVL